jgi:hypothetical protein
MHLRCRIFGYIKIHVSVTKSLSDNYEVSSPMYNEICTIINELESNKATGLGSIPPQLIKNGRQTLKQTA